MTVRTLLFTDVVDSTRMVEQLGNARAIKKKENASVFNVVYSYKALVRRLLGDGPEHVPRLVGYLRFYAEYARAQGMPFVYERGLNFDFVEPQRRARVSEVFDRLST